MMITRIVAERMKKLLIQFAANSYDLKNAFGSPDQAELKQHFKESDTTILLLPGVAPKH